MCQNCQTTHLSRKLPSPKDLDKLDKFDLSFLMMTGYATINPPLQALALVQKAADVILWGPEAAMMTIALRKGWKAAGWDALAAQIEDCFDLTGDISVDSEKLHKILDSKKYKTVGVKAWNNSKEKVLAVEQKLMQRSDKYFKKTSKRVEKVDKKWLNGYAKSAAVTMQETIDLYPSTDMSRTILDVEAQAAKTLGKRTVDKLALKKRVKAISDMPYGYVSTVADVEAGRVWNHVGMRYAYESGFNTYQVISEEDNNVCPVCTMIHGRTFSVQYAMEKIDSYVAGGGGVESASSAFPFPRAKALDNRSPDDWGKMDLTPPFHPRCRCDVTLIFTSATTTPTTPPTPRPKAPPTVKPKPKPRPTPDNAPPHPRDIGPPQPVPPIKPAHVRAGGTPRKPDPVVKPPTPPPEENLIPGTNVPLNGRQVDAMNHMDEAARLINKEYREQLGAVSAEALAAYDGAVARMRELLGTRDMAFCMNRTLYNGSGSWKGYMKDGKMKNQYQLRVRTSGGSNSAYKGGGRDSWEDNLFGGSFQKNPEYKSMASGPEVRMPAGAAAERPKYGYIFDPDKPFTNHRYGDVCFRFKKEAVLNRTTFTIGNSSGSGPIGAKRGGAAYGNIGAGTSSTPSNLVRKRVEHKSIERSSEEIKKRLEQFNRKNFRGFGHGTEYVEIQIHGDLQLTRDVEKVFFPDNSAYDYVEELCKKYKLKYHRYTYAEKEAMKEGKKEGWWFD